MQNPFNPYQPVEGRLFANRKQEQTWFQRDLIPSLAPDSLGTYNAAILGPWGIGKSSLVRRLRYLVMQMMPTPVAMAFTSCTVGFGSMMGFCDAIVNAVRQEALRLSQWDQTLEEELMRWSFEIRLPGISASRTRGSNAELSVSAAEFLRLSLLRLWERAFRVHGNGVLIVLDDVNFLQAIDPQALMLMRAVFQDLHMYQARYGLVITGPVDLFSEARDIAEPVTRFFEHLTLTAFTLDDMYDAVREPIQAVQAPLNVEDDAIIWLWERTQGHPYFVTYVMHYAFQAAMDAHWLILTKAQLRQLWPTIVSRLDQGKFRYDWNSATPSEQKTLVAIAHDHFDRVNRGLVTRLMRKGLVIKIERGQYRLYHPMFQDYVLRVGDS
ncbi:MAG: AAA family ATPase [Firmicutes bacterium]|nr:AAA family ATPase [Bacillota bacterium]